MVLFPCISTIVDPLYLESMNDILIQLNAFVYLSLIMTSVVKKTSKCLLVSLITKVDH